MLGKKFYTRSVHIKPAPDIHWCGHKFNFEPVRWSCIAVS